jgi:hypothetical protein
MLKASTALSPDPRVKDEDKTMKEEDWKKISDPLVGRRVQNRIAQVF